jgi:hypothetical protein
MSDTKTCKRCSIEKKLSEFRKGRAVCRTCVSIEAKEYYQKNKERILEYSREYRKNNTDKLNLYDKERRDSLTAEEKDAKKKYHKQYQEKNKERIAEQKRIKYQDNKHEINHTKKEYNNRYRRERKQRDPEYKILVNLRRRMNSAIKNGSGFKCGSSKELLGGELEVIKEHLESQFTNGMSWDNYGYDGWHIDHIKPCSSFNMSDPVQQRECFHYTNLQPLWKRDNLIKGNKLFLDKND